MTDLTPISLEQARSVGNQVGCDWTELNVEHFRRGLEHELAACKTPSVTHLPLNFLVLMGRFVQARLLVWRQMNELRDHYQQLDQFENEGGGSSFGD